MVILLGRRSGAGSSALSMAAGLQAGPSQVGATSE